jgi:hypothetical protein
MNIDLKVMKESLPGFTVQSIASKGPDAAVLRIEGYLAKIIYEEAQKIAAEIYVVAP